jgi:glucoamylase
MEALEDWLDRQYRHSAACLLRSVSSDVVKTRAGFGQIIRPRKGSIVASPVPASYDPDPDYFFHWFRDSAMVVDALRLLSEDPAAGVDTRQHFADFVHFSSSLYDLDGRALIEPAKWRGGVTDDYRKYLRADADLARSHGKAIGAETRVNPDGTLDISSWPRPQYDGPPLRALTLLRWMRTHRFDSTLTAAVNRLLRGDLDMTMEHDREACFDIWEEEQGFHYYTLRVSAAALRAGAKWLEEGGEALPSRAFGAAAREILRQLDGYWLHHEGYFRSRVLASGLTSGKELDIAVILAAVHAGDSGGDASSAGADGHADVDADAGRDNATHLANDPRLHATLSRLEALFDAAYPINRSRPPDRAPAMGRYAGDVYFSGGAYYFSTLGAAEFCFQAALGAADPHAHIRRGDAYLRTVRAFTPPSGDLSEQFDQRTGEQRSAKHLAWSYAALISCVAARRRAFRAVTRAPPAATSAAPR